MDLSGLSLNLVADLLGYTQIVAYLIAAVMMATWVMAFWQSVTTGHANNAALALYFGSIANLFVALMGATFLALSTDNLHTLILARLWVLISTIIFILSGWLADRKSNNAD